MKKRCKSILFKKIVLPSLHNQAGVHFHLFGLCKPWWLGFCILFINIYEMWMDLVGYEPVNEYASMVL